MQRKIKKRRLAVIGLDEVGRGALSGPVVAVAVCLKKEIDFPVKDSKKYSEKKREEICKKLLALPWVIWGIGSVYQREIERVNILEATKLAMQKALLGLDCRNAQIIIDGNFKIETDIRQKSMVRADEKVIECSIASVIAKVERDRLMRKYDKLYPEYGFGKHKGYGTYRHRRAIKEYGPCTLHRKTFRLGI